jgi:hypothetical protein
MKTFVSFLALVFLSLNIIKAEELKILVPDFNKIENEISDQKSKFYYPLLFSRYISGDSTLTQEDYHYLYFGYPFNPKYKTEYNSALQDSLFETLKLAEHKKEDIKKLISMSEELLKENPFELRFLNILFYAESQSSSRDSVIITSRKLKGIFDAITNSGTGKTCDDPMHVINFSDAHEIIKMLSINMINHALTDACDKFILGPNSYNLKALYFDVSRPLYFKNSEN